MKLMNVMLYTVFTFQLLIILIMSSMSIGWRNENKDASNYLEIAETTNMRTWFI